MWAERARTYVDIDDKPGPRTQHALMLEERQIQAKTGRIIPQANEEYGYEDHYPHWAPKPDGDSAETLRTTSPTWNGFGQSSDRRLKMPLQRQRAGRRSDPVRFRYAALGR